MSATRALRAGDVFTIPLDDDRVGYGQIVHDWGSGHYYFAVFDAVGHPDGEHDVDTLASRPVILLGLASDALLHHGHWRLIGHREIVPDEVPWPEYKEARSPGVFEVVDYTGTRRRRASPKEVETLNFRPVVAPIVVENALKALHGLREWDEAYDKLVPSPQTPRTAK